MYKSTTSKPPFWYWIVSAIALIWNALGVDGYFSQVYNTERYQNSFSAEDLELASSMPSWTTGAFAIAVFTGVIAAFGLLLRKKWATLFWIISLIAVILQMGYALINGYVSHMVMTIMIIVFAFLFLWFSKHAQLKNWLA
ncbi:hypothetical protein GCM10022291_06590 [Postechiella marina]|uniref:Uncharacterized protein n=1 Tax=Postechiella marina TaxID=943941 RepID=A0ABP8C205_9FLAO